MELDGVVEKTVTLHGLDVTYAESGTGTRGVILFVHGFPEYWYSWRYQLQAFGLLGYRAVAPDLRGYDGNNLRTSITEYSCMDIVGDVFAFLDAIVPDNQVFLVGHDWGAVLAGYMVMFRPDRFKALVNLSLIFMPRDPEHKPLEILEHRYGPDFYACRFQEPGEIEAEFAEIGIEDVLKGMYNLGPEPLLLPKGNYFKPSPPLPKWLSPEDLQKYVDKFKKTGFHRPLNYYRNFDRNWELTASWNGATGTVPSMFIIGDRDITYDCYGMKDYVDGGKHRNNVPNLEKAIVIPGASHFIQQERHEEINNYIYEFFVKHKFQDS